MTASPESPHRATSPALAVLAVVGASSQQVAGLIMTILAARYVLPADFGVYMLAVVFAELGLVFSYSGFFHYLISSDRPDDTVISTLFWVILGIGLITGAALFIAAEPLAVLLDAPELSSVLKVFAFLQPFAALIGWATACLKRAQRMRRYFCNHLISNVVAVIFGAVALFYLQSLYALVVFRVARLALSLVLFLPAVPHRPRLHFDHDLFRDAFSQARALYGARLATFLASYGTDLLLAFIFTTAESGLYRFANRLAQAAIDIVALPMKSFALKSFGHAARTGLAPNSLIRDYILSSAFLMGGIALTQILLGEVIIATLFSAEYAAAIWGFYALSLRHAFLFGGHLVEPVFASFHRSQMALRYSLKWALATTAVSVLLAPFGLETLAFGQAIITLMSTQDALRIFRACNLLQTSAVSSVFSSIGAGFAFYAATLGLAHQMIDEVFSPSAVLLLNALATLGLSALLCRWATKRGFLVLSLFSSR